MDTDNSLRINDLAKHLCCAEGSVKAMKMQSERKIALPQAFNSAI
jgi:hypothetical protein